MPRHKLSESDLIPTVPNPENDISSTVEDSLKPNFCVLKIIQLL